MTRPFYIVDVFAECRYAGNQLAVVLGADGLPGDAMGRIAAETNYSETAFANSTPEGDGAFRVRLFTPAREIDFAGHPLLGSGWVIRHHLLTHASGHVRLRIAAGDISVSFETSADGREVAWFRAPPVSFGQTCPPARIAAAVGVSPEDIAIDAPVQVLSAGTSVMIVPMRSLRSLRQSQLDLEAFASLAADGFPPLLYLYCHETRDADNDVCARFFFEAHGVREDPATGNGAAFLGAYLLEHRVFARTDLDLRIEQGFEIRRPSLVLLRARMVGGYREVNVGGCVIPIVRGELL
jgi:trans-2,3-dihydro-3-hydroxyanthranilate isomerase